MCRVSLHQVRKLEKTTKQGGESRHHQNHVTFLVGDPYCTRDFPLFYLAEEDPKLYYIYFSHTIHVWYLTYIYHKNKNQPYHTWMAWVILFLVCLVLCWISNCRSSSTSLRICVSGAGWLNIIIELAEANRAEWCHHQKYTAF